MQKPYICPFPSMNFRASFEAGLTRLQFVFVLSGLVLFIPNRTRGDAEILPVFEFHFHRLKYGIQLMAHCMREHLPRLENGTAKMSGSCHKLGQDLHGRTNGNTCISSCT